MKTFIEWVEEKDPIFKEKIMDYIRNFRHALPSLGAGLGVVGGTLIGGPVGGAMGAGIGASLGGSAYNALGGYKGQKNQPQPKNQDASSPMKKPMAKK